MKKSLAWIAGGLAVIIGLSLVFPKAEDKNNSSVANSEISDMQNNDIIEYEANELAENIDNDAEFEKSLKNKIIQVTGTIKENELSNDELYIYADFNSGGWIQCEMSDINDLSKVNPKDIVTVKGTVKSTSGHLVMEECTLLSVETPTEPETETTELTTEALSEEVQADEPTEPITRKYIINTESGKYHYSDCHTIEDSTSLTEYYGTIEELKEQGYTQCGVCEPR